MPSLLFCCSLALAIVVSGLIAVHASDTASRFWCVLAGVALQIGVIAIALSALHALTPVGWITLQGVIAASAAWFRRSDLRGLIPRSLAVPAPSGPIFWIVFLIAIVLTCSLTTQIATPISGYDERMYHASRVLYWIENHGIFPYTTHNDRQVAFGNGSEIFLLWGILLTHSELVARLLAWTAFPLSCAGLALLTYELVPSRIAAAIGTLAFATAPIVFDTSIGAKAELWLVIYVLGALFFLIRAIRGVNPAVSAASIGIFAALAFNVKFTAAALCTVVALIVLVKSGTAMFARFAAGFAVSGLLCGLLLTLAFNLFSYGNALGSYDLRRVGASEISPRNTATQLVRTALLFIDPPSAPVAVREAMSNAGRRLLHSAGLDRPLPLEDDGNHWPGPYNFGVPEWATRYSIAGMFCVPIALICAVIPLIRRGVDTLGALAIANAGLFFAIVILVRWMTESQVPERLLPPVYAASVAITAGALYSRFAQHRALLVAGALLLAWQVAPAVVFDTERCAAALQHEGAGDPDEPFGRVLDYIRDGSNILLVGAGDVRDYPLFGPMNGYPNHVWSWGRYPFDAARLANLLSRHDITHVVVEDTPVVDRLDTSGIVNAMRHLAGWREVVAQAPLLFARADHANDCTRNASRFLRIAQYPRVGPIVQVDDALTGKVGVVPSAFSTFYRPENTPAWGNFVWLGTGEVEGARGALFASHEMRLQMCFHVMAGYSRTDAERTVRLQTGSATPQAAHFTTEGDVCYPVNLVSGYNEFSFAALDAATVPAQPNGDRRHLIVILRRITVRPE